MLTGPVGLKATFVRLAPKEKKYCPTKNKGVCKIGLLFSFS